MTNLSWQPDITLGITTLDTQYQSLYLLLAKLEEAIKHRNTSQFEPLSTEIKRICSRIYNYERPLLNIEKENNTNNHILSYIIFLEKIERLNTEIDTGDKLTAARKLYFEVKSWLTAHLEKIDKQLSENLNLSELKAKNLGLSKKMLSGFIGFFR